MRILNGPESRIQQAPNVPGTIKRKVSRHLSTTCAVHGLWFWEEDGANVGHWAAFGKGFTTADLRADGTCWRRQFQRLSGAFPASVFEIRAFLYFSAGMNSIVVYVCSEVFATYFPVSWSVPATHAAQLAMDLWGAALWVGVAAALHYKGVFIAI